MKQNYIKKFMDTIIKYSLSKNYDEAIKEWVEIDYSSSPHEDFCICGHEIEQNCHVQNIHNMRILVIGNCCIKKFGIKRSINMCFAWNKKHSNRLCIKRNECPVKECDGKRYYKNEVKK